MKILKKLTPRYTKVLTTASLEVQKAYYPGTTIEDPARTVSGYSCIQEVIAVGNSVSGITPGMKVLIDFERYARPVQAPTLKNSMKGEQNVRMEYRIPVIFLDGQEVLNLDDNDIKFIIDEMEDKPEEEAMAEDIREEEGVHTVGEA